MAAAVKGEREEDLEETTERIAEGHKKEMEEDHTMLTERLHSKKRQVTNC